MTRRKSDEYQFPCALIRGNERTLLSRNDMLKIIEAKQMSHAMSVLAEFGYGDGREMAAPGDFERVLRMEQSRVNELVFSILPDRTELELLHLPADYHNLKVLLKAEALGQDADSLLVDGGSLPKEKLVQMVRERNFIFLSDTMRHAVQDAIDLFVRGRDPQEIDITLDKACYKEMKERADAVGESFLIGYVQLLIDILNLSAFIRLRQMKKNWMFFQKVFLEGGTIDEKVFTAGYEEAYQQFADKVAPYGFREMVAAGGGLVKDTGKYTLLEKLSDDLRMKYIRDAKYITVGLAPIAAFYLAKESEIKNLRMVLTGKAAGLSEDIMKERLRETYV